MAALSRFGSFGPSFTAALGCVLTLALQREALGQSSDDAVLDSAADVMSNEYANQHFTSARKKLESLLKNCGKKACAKAVRGELYRDLGVVLLGLGKKKQALGAFERALQIDPDGRLDPELASPRVSEAFKSVGGQIGEAERPPEPEPEPEPDAKSESAAPASEDEEPATSDGSAHSWLSFSVQQDFLFHQETRPACGTTQYGCFDGGHEYTGPIWSGYGNQIAPGLAMATTRLLLGYDQLLGENVELGFRVGWAFGGGPSAPSGGKFMPFHAELRGAVFFGKAPFAGSSVRPYLALGAGFAEVQSHLSTDLYQSAADYAQAKQTTVDAWRTSGRGFVAPTIGCQFPFSKGSALTLELRTMVMLGVLGIAPGGSLGFAQGF